MTVASDLLLDIASEKNGYSIGKPWRFTDFSLAAVVPIVRAVDSRQRSYRLLSEVVKDVKIKDTGSIEQVEITNKSPYPVLMKAGEVVAGATQTRALAKSEILMPGETVVADCVCVYSTKGIRAGQQVTPVTLSPTEVRQSLYKGYYSRDGRLGVGYDYSADIQNKIWSSVNAYSATLGQSARGLSAFAASPMGRSYGLDEVAPLTPGFSTPGQDLAGRVAESEDKFKEVIKKIPTLDNQVGMVLLTMSGLDILESFEHPESWSAIRKEILKAESGKISDLSDTDNVFEFKEEKARSAIRELLTGKFEESMVVEKPDTTTFVLDREKFTGEVVTLYGAPIHVTFVKKAS